MRKLLIALAILITSVCAGIMPVEAEELSCNEKLANVCDYKISAVAKTFREVLNYNNVLHSMIREDKDDFVPILFAQFKMENTAILLYSVMVELSHVTEEGKLSNMTIPLLEQYIELLRDNMMKAKMFEGMIKDPDKWFDISSDRLVLVRTTVNLKVAHDLLVQIKEELEALRCE